MKLKEQMLTEAALTFGTTTMYAVTSQCPTCQYENAVDLKGNTAVQKIRKCKQCNASYYPILNNSDITRAIVKHMITLKYNSKRPHGF